MHPKCIMNSTNSKQSEADKARSQMKLNQMYKNEMMIIIINTTNYNSNKLHSYRTSQFRACL